MIIKCNRLLVPLLCLFSFCLDASQIKVVMYGDSISAGYGMTIEESWPYLLNETFIVEGSEINLINESISGETTGGGLARIENVLKRHQLVQDDWLIIELGGNDGLRGFPTTTIKRNLTQMITKLKANNVNIAIMQIKIPPNYGKRYTTMFEGLYPALAEQFDIPIMPFFMDSIAINPSYMLQDGIHPNKSAQVIIRDIMKPAIEKLITDN
ncbi:arylesterase [Psychrosphaera sp. B3R10]|nr:arylesterase [Psychrosphaera sp. I2R16]MBU2988094.1 arylesterase [Psychrosphaera sp. B3R10]